jgi:hypothetical protein
MHCLIYSPAGTGGGANEEDNPDSVYMFAWALDGWRIGESGAGPTNRAESPNSITAPLMVRRQYVEWSVLIRHLCMLVGRNKSYMSGVHYLEYA